MSSLERIVVFFKHGFVRTSDPGAGNAKKFVGGVGVMHVILM